MKTNNYAAVSETSEMPYFLRFLRSAPQKGLGVGNVGNTYRFPTVPTPPLRRRFGYGKIPQPVLIGAGA